MEDERFWRELHVEFSALHERAGDLHATHDPTTPEEIADLIHHAAELAKSAIQGTSEESVEVAFHHARAAARGAAALLDGLYAQGYWAIIGGPRNNNDRAVIQAEFRVLGERAAAGTGALTAEDGRERAVQVWLHLLKERRSPFLTIWGLELVCAASAHMCRELATDAYRQASRVRGSSQPAAAQDQGAADNKSSLVDVAEANRKDRRAPQELQDKRRKLVHAVKTARGYDDLKVLVKHLPHGLSTDAVHAIIRGDFKRRCSEETRLAFLLGLGVDERQWDDIDALDRRLNQLNP